MITCPCCQSEEVFYESKMLVSQRVIDVTDRYVETLAFEDSLGEHTPLEEGELHCRNCAWRGDKTLYLTLMRNVLRQLSSEEQTQWMEDWFRKNFEDPAETTPHDEGDYVWIFGGPYNPSEELQEKFGALVPYPVIAALAERLADEKWEWAAKLGGEKCPPEMFADDSDEEPLPPESAISVEEASPQERTCSYDYDEDPRV